MDQTEVTTGQVEVKGMSCGHCVARLERVLQRLDDVEVERVEIGAVTFRHEPRTDGRARVVEAIRGAGFEPA